MKRFDQIHETAVKEVIDLFDTIKNVTADGTDGSSILRKIGKNRSSGGYHASSIAKATSDMTVVFPMLASRAVGINTAAMCAKANEKKCVTMLQLLFSAYQVSDKDNAIDFIKQFHSNLDSKFVSPDDILDVFGRLSESDTHIDKSRLKAVMEDLKYNTNTVLPADINECSLNNYGVYNSAGKPRIIVEAASARMSTNNRNRAARDPMKRYDGPSGFSVRGGVRFGAGGSGGGNGGGNRGYEDTYAYDNDGNRVSTTRIYDEPNVRTFPHTNIPIPGINGDIGVNIDPIAIKDRNYWNKHKDDYENNIDVTTYDDMKAYADTISKQILPGDIKKANELMPTTLLVNYKYVDPAHPELGPVDICSVVIGVKTKLYYTDSADMINHIVSKTNDKNWITQFFRGTTREISFLKDFVLAIDRAKIDAMSMSNKGTSSSAWKALERRASGSKLRRATGNSAGAVSAITTLLISKEEVELIKRTKSIDIERVSVAKNLMEGYNLLGICIADDSLEVAKFMFDDGDPMWENISYTNLEREASDNAYKKVVNMMTKVAR